MELFSKAAAIFAILLMSAGCASQPQTQTDNDFGQVVSRKAVGAGQVSWVYARAVYENPINRPVSSTVALGSYALKSVGGLLRRTAISTAQMPALSDDIPAVSAGEPLDTASFEKAIDQATGTQQEQGQIKFLVDGDEYFSRLLETIENAQSRIDIRTFIFDNDDFAVALADELKERSADVKVRVMVDSIGNIMATQNMSESVPEDFAAPLSMKSYLTQDSDVKYRNYANPWMIISDHTKTTIIDEKIAFVGGMNIGREYRYDWHDLMMEVTGPVVDELQFESDKAWARSSLFGDLAHFARALRGKRNRAANDNDNDYPIRVLQTKSFNSEIYKAQVAAIRNARSHIIIENAYFTDDRMIYELAKARLRGVDVRVIIPANGNHGAVNASNLVTINTLLRRGIRVYEYPGMSHVKAAIYDGWICVGSANFDKLSLDANQELNLATSDPATVNALLKRVFIPDLMMSEEITNPVPVTASSYLAEIVVDELL